ncbi:lipocalin Cav p 3.0101-like [Dipodomys spectabilis]|uniref:lipocalin Cav p 3.0101-like n=1 Tax=Dipodomys spectabilis TaxID=105255 RepID=UPI001C53A4ED|nr:lipocalin Cav p 3.0101-like [Dipodomys spectabilis]
MACRELIEWKATILDGGKRFPGFHQGRCKMELETGGGGCPSPVPTSRPALSFYSPGLTSSFLTMKALFFALLFGVAFAEIQPSQVTGTWHTLAIIANRLKKIEEDGPLRGLFRYVEAPEDGRSMTVQFYNKQTGECKKYTVVGTLRDDGLYVGQYDGLNEFELLEQSSHLLIFHNKNTDEEGQVTHMILVAGKGERLTEEEKQRLEEFAEKKGIPMSSIQYVQETDDCPEK